MHDARFASRRVRHVSAILLTYAIGNTDPFVPARVMPKRYAPGTKGLGLSPVPQMARAHTCLFCSFLEGTIFGNL